MIKIEIPNYGNLEDLVTTVQKLVAAHNREASAYLDNHPVHPWYGPCDAFDDGQCRECKKTIVTMKKNLSDARHTIRGLNIDRPPVTEPERILPSGEDLSVSYFKENGSVSVDLRTSHVQLATVEAICRWLEKDHGANFTLSSIEKLQADARRVTEEAM